MEIDFAQLALIWAAVIFAAVLRAFTGFGFALAAVPVFSLFLPPSQAVVLGSALILAISLLNIRSFMGVVPLRPVAPLLFMAVLGTGVGVLLLTLISANSFQLWAGMLVILVCAVMTFYKPSASTQNPFAVKVAAAIAGLLAGLMNGVLAMPGPPIIIFTLMTKPDPQHSRAQLMTLLMAAAVIALISYALAGFITEQSLLNFLLAFPAMLLGDKLGSFLFARFGQALYRKVAIVALLAVGVATLFSALS
jgi:uncharacterized membrane protein YfcA